MARTLASIQTDAYNAYNWWNNLELSSPRFFNVTLESDPTTTPLLIKLPFPEGGLNYGIP